MRYRILARSYYYPGTIGATPNGALRNEYDDSIMAFASRAAADRWLRDPLILGCGDPVGGVLPGVDDHALRAWAGRRDVAVRGPGPCGEAGDEHPGRLSTGVVMPGTGAQRLRMRWRCSREPRLA